jgi:hypothetical protein
VVDNRVDPDESRALGLLLVAAGALGIVLHRRRGVVRAQAVTALFMLALAGGEAAVRWENGRVQRAYSDRLVRFVDDRELVYDFAPGRSCGKLSTNDLGMIDVPRRVDNPEGALRVACAGDSVGGDCDLPGEAVCSALERALRDARGGRPTEGLNFSIPGYNTMQEARSLELKAAPFSPDAAVVLYVLNDPYPDLAIASVMPGHLAFEHALYAGAAMTAARLYGHAADPIVSGFDALHRAPRSWDGVVVRGFDRIRAFAEARGIPVVVAIFPLFIEGGGPELGRIYTKVADEAARHGFIPVNLATEAFANEPLDGLLRPSRDMIHPNARAHRLAGEAIARALLTARPELVRK